jgi:hypothetical protein
MANMIIKVEKSKEGWELIGPKIQDLLKDPEYKKLKDAYDALKPAAPKKGASLSDPRRENGERFASLNRAADFHIVRYDVKTFVNRRFDS